MKTVVAIPTYNEKDTIELIVRKVFEAQPNVSIMVVDDNSPDGTAFIVERLMKEFPRLTILKRKQKEGLGKAYVAAFTEIMKDPEVNTIITIDADYSHDPKYIGKLLEYRKDYDVVIGSRYVHGGKTEGWENWRKFLSRAGNAYTRMITRIPIHDTTAGYNAMSTDILRKINLPKVGSSGYAYTIELKYLFYKAGAKIKEIPITFKNRIFGESKISNHIISEAIKIPWRVVFNKKI